MEDSEDSESESESEESSDGEEGGEDEQVELAMKKFEASLKTLDPKGVPDCSVQ